MCWKGKDRCVLETSATLNQSCYLFGGSFDPPHRGHQGLLARLLQLACEQGVDHVRIMPASLSPFKLDSGHADAEHRLNMLDLMVRDTLSAAVPEKDSTSPVGVVVDDYEILQEGVSYTSRTVQYLKGRRLQPILVIGSDNVSGLPRWHDCESLLSETSVLVFMRRGMTVERVRQEMDSLERRYPHSSMQLLEFFPPDCSSTELRNALGRSLHFSEEPDPLDYRDECLCRSVYDYIRRFGLYG